MNVFIASEFRCHIFKDEYYLSEKAYSIYKRYSEAFGEIVLCSRFIRIDNLEKGLSKANFIADIIDVKALSKTLINSYNRCLKEKIKDCDLVIGRLPSIIAYKACKIAHQLNKPCLVELMCDGWDPYWNHGLQGKIIAPYMHLNMKGITYNADYAIYVTEKYLQKRYPCKNKSINASNVVICKPSKEILLKRLNKIKLKENYSELSVMTSANVDLLSKGHRYVIRAMGQLKKRGIKIIYYLAGGGNGERLLLEAQKANVQDQVVFLGSLTLEEIYNQIDKVDLYIQPSLQEGLPRAVIEAMSRACPCLGARTAGIPELLDEECIFERKSENDIVRAILYICGQDLNIYAVKNFLKSEEFTESILNDRRERYFEMIKQTLKLSNND